MSLTTAGSSEVRSPAPDVLRSRIIGIDLGTTNSLVSFIRDGNPRIIPNERGDRMTPSVVCFREDGQIIVGELAKNQAVLNADRTIARAKLGMGRNAVYSVDGEPRTAPEISGHILTSLKTCAERYLGCPVQDAVITVPAYFDDRQREDTLQAARLAGLTVHKLLNEPTAAALTYGLGQETGAHLLVIDLGGGTFDITLMEYENRIFRVRGVGGSTEIGGGNLDRKVVEYILSEFEATHGVDLQNDRIALQQVVIQAEKAKIDLSATSETRIMIPYVTATASGPIHLNQLLTRERFEQLIRPVMDEIRMHILQTFQQTGLDADWVDTVIMVGGSTRVPALEHLVRELIASGGDKPDAGDSGTAPVCRLKRDINPDEAVARGAGILAGILEGSMTGIEFHDITPHDLGVEDDDGNFISILSRGTVYPAEASRLLTTTRDHQEDVTIHVLQQVGMAPTRQISLGWFRLKTDPARLRGETNIDVTFAIDANGLLRVSAMDLDRGEQKTITIRSKQTPDTLKAGTGQSPELQGQVSDRSKIQQPID